MIQEVTEFIKNTLPLCSNKMDFIFKLEVKFAKYLVDKGYKWNTVVKSKDLNTSKVVCPVFNPVNIQKWINNPNTFAIKSLEIQNKYCGDRRNLKTNHNNYMKA